MPKIINRVGQAAAVMSGEIAAGGGITREIYHDPQKDCYYYFNDDSWMRCNLTQLYRRLSLDGYSSKRPEGAPLSPMDRRICQINETSYVSYAGPLAGYWPGIIYCNGNRILVTTPPKLIEPAPGDWPLIGSLLAGLFLHEEIDQRDYFHGWMKVAYTALSTRKHQPGQALVLAGPRGCGKSLLQELITEILGGRKGRPYQYMSGMTPFNSDLFHGEHLMMEDDQPLTTLAARRDFGCRLKEITVNPDQRMHGKGREAIILQPFWRVTISLNDEPENLMTLPPLDDSIADKVSLFLCRWSQMPMPAETGEQRAEFRRRLSMELPAYLYWLNQWEMPDQIKSKDRFGVKTWQHISLVEEINGMAPEVQLLTYVDALLFTTPAAGAWEGSAEELQRELTSNDFQFSRQADKLLSWNNAAGVYLSRLASKQSSRVKRFDTARHAKRMWQIVPP